MPYNRSTSYAPRTSFLSISTRRAITPARQQRVSHLAELEGLLWRGQNGNLGIQGHLLSAFSKKFPVSYLAMELELARDGNAPGVIELAELIELGLKTWQPVIRDRE